MIPVPILSRGGLGHLIPQRLSAKKSQGIFHGFELHGESAVSGARADLSAEDAVLLAEERAVVWI